MIAQSSIFGTVLVPPSTPSGAWQSWLGVCGTTRDFNMAVQTNMKWQEGGWNSKIILPFLRLTSTLDA